MRELVLMILLFLMSGSFSNAQQLPKAIRTYLDLHYKGWKLAPSKKDCGPDVNPGYVSGYFNDDSARDYALKFTRKGKGYIMAFIRTSHGFKPFALHHRYDEHDALYSTLGVWKKGEVFEYNNKKLRLRRDAPSDYLCESDVGGIHYFQNGKFVGY